MHLTLVQLCKDRFGPPWLRGCNRPVLQQNYSASVVVMFRQGISVAFNYLLTPWSSVLLEKLTGSQLVKKFPAYYGTRRFITAFKSARHLFLSRPSSIQSIPSHLTSWISILILTSHRSLDLPSGLLPQISPLKPSMRLSSPRHVLHAPPISLFSI